MPKTSVMKTWLTTGKNRNNPQPVVYPVCSTCDEAWVYRRCLSFATGGYVWAWMRDCKHKVDPKLHEPEVGGDDDA